MMISIYSHYIYIIVFYTDHNIYSYNGQVRKATKKEIHLVYNDIIL